MSLNPFEGGNLHITEDQYKSAVESELPYEAETIVALMRRTREMDRFVYIVRSGNFEVAASVNRDEELAGVISDIDAARANLGLDPRRTP